MKFKLTALAAVSALALVGCATETTEPEATAVVETAVADATDAATDTVDAVVAAADDVADAAVAATADAKADMTKSEPMTLEAILAAQPEDVQARYDARNPAETIAFFGLEPGMTVVEALPGGGWYSKILMPYLGPEGQLVGAQYPATIWPIIFPAADAERVAEITERNNSWSARTAEWNIEDGAAVSQYDMTMAGEGKADMADAVLFIRALHNLHRAEAEARMFTDTIAETYKIVKPGGIVGVVQHRGPETNSDEWADGDAGYLKQSRVVEAFEAAGFVLEATSEVNANPADQPTEEDVVWRLPPSTGTTEEGTPERAAMEAIGESDRMTLLFRKPA